MIIKSICGPLGNYKLIRCFVYEFLTGEILFKGKQELEQMELIYEMCGSELWPEVEFYKYYETMKPAKTYQYNLRNKLF